MSAQSVIEFGAFVKSNPDVQEKMKSAESLEVIELIAKDNGFDVTKDEIHSAFMNAVDDEELTAEQLEAVAGGAIFAGITAAGVAAGASVGGSAVGVGVGGRQMNWW